MFCYSEHYVVVLDSDLGLAGRNLLHVLRAGGKLVVPLEVAEQMAYRIACNNELDLRHVYRAFEETMNTDFDEKEEDADV